MVLNKYRSRVDPIMKPIAQKLEKVNPDVLSWLAILFAVLAGYLFVAAWDYDHDLLLLAFLAIILNAVLDALDGYVARFTGKASRLGDYLDHVLDRYADAFIFGGIAISGYVHTPVGIVAIFGVFFTSYMGTQGQAIGLKRNYGGILGRADRLALLLLFTLAQWVYIVVTDDVYLVTLDMWGTDYPLTLLEVFMIFVAVLGNLTAIQRGTAAWKDLKQMEADGTLDAPEPPQGLVTVEAVDEDAAGEADETEEAMDVEAEEIIEVKASKGASGEAEEDEEEG
ncbi:MAG: CDP-alcohol phosphatidyltransferase family protein [Thermoplasmata archaeon]|nr:MAG: CDP-alcohol phosphatidyltransferase family protein [Thermoplasmata archaeon]